MMNSTRWLVAVAATVFSSALVFAQLPDSDPPSRPSEQSAVLSGKVVEEAGSKPSEPANVVLDCENQVRAHAYSDNAGTFELIVPISEGVSVSNPAADAVPTASKNSWAGCEVYAEAPGFRSDRRRLSEPTGTGRVNVGDIALHPLAAENTSLSRPTEGKFTVSVTSLGAPDKAKKALEKGVQAERKGKWESARDYFTSAIKLYPRYALAWLELGRLQLKQNSLLEANESFRQAVEQDSRLTDGYVELAHVAAQQQNWHELADVTDRLVAQLPESSPEYWFLNSAAYYNLGDLKQAENSILHGRRLDARHQIPQIEYLYGLILGSKKDFKSAAEHINAYLRLAPNAQDKEAAQNLLSAYQYRAQIAEADQQDGAQ